MNGSDDDDENDEAKDEASCEKPAKINAPLLLNNSGSAAPVLTSTTMSTAGLNIDTLLESSFQEKALRSCNTFYEVEINSFRGGNATKSIKQIRLSLKFIDKCIQEERSDFMKRFKEASEKGDRSNLYRMKKELNNIVKKFRNGFYGEPLRNANAPVSLSSLGKKIKENKDDGLEKFSRK